MTRWLRGSRNTVYLRPPSGEVASTVLIGAQDGVSSARMSIDEIDKHRPKLEAIDRAVASFFNLTPEELHKKSFQRSVVVPRQIAIYMAKQMTAASLPEIGSYFGLHHTTVMHSIAKIHEQRGIDAATESLIRKLLKSLEAV